MNNLETTILKTRNVGKVTQTTVQFNKKNTFLHMDEMADIIKSIKKKVTDNGRLVSIPLIRVLNGSNWVTFTNEDDYLEYYEGKVKDKAKFEDFYQIQITVHTQAKK